MGREVEREKSQAKMRYFHVLFYLLNVGALTPVRQLGRQRVDPVA